MVEACCCCAEVGLVNGPHLLVGGVRSVTTTLVEVEEEQQGLRETEGEWEEEEVGWNETRAQLEPRNVRALSEDEDNTN